ncbi:MAG TPA: hypothetical protein PKL31_07975 [Fulvivirga sp.]|nr:hypothetical protein [Fulvivirga sp.]
MNKILSIIIKLAFFALLTILTQVGGLVFLLSLLISRHLKQQFRFKLLTLFVVFYLISTYILIPIISPFFGRERVDNTAIIHPTNYLTILLNRNYVAPELNELFKFTEKKLENTDIQIHYLDANFPFLIGFPLLPHLSHNDGRKIDLSLIYETKEGQISTQQKSNSGYGVFEKPKPNEVDQVSLCLNKGYIQYDYPKYMTFGSINNNLLFSEKGTKTLIIALLESKNMEKLFIEPHLKERLNLESKRIRYHGCKAVRHDNHIHVQVKR